MNTGIIRKLDELGRIVLPMELRRKLEISTDDEMEFCIQDNYIILIKQELKCTFCGVTENLSDFHGKKLCQACRQEITDMDSSSSAR